MLNKFLCIFLICALVFRGSLNQDVSVCNQPKEVGLCRGYFVRYYYNPASEICEQFIYGGCGGNGNNFENIEDCRQLCEAKFTIEPFPGPTTPADSTE